MAHGLVSYARITVGSLRLTAAGLALWSVLRIPRRRPAGAYRYLVAPCLYAAAYTARPGDCRLLA